MQNFHQSSLSVASKIFSGRLRAALLLCVLLCMPLSKAQAEVQRGAVYLGDTLLWKCQLLSETGTYYHESYTMQFRTIEPTTDTKSETLCAGDVLLWRCQQLSESGTYKDTLRSLEFPELDSVYYTMNLTVRTTSVAEWDTIYLHQNDFPYTWEGETCDAPGEYTHWTTYDPEGCNKEMLRVRLVLRDTIEMTGCEGDTILWRCTPAYETKVYNETVTVVGAVSGEETLTELHYLDFTYRTTSVAEWDTIYLHQNDFPYEWNDEVCPTPGEYFHWTKYDPEGCNKEMLRVRLVLRDTIEMTGCEGDTILWRCTPAYETKVYDETVTVVGAVSGEETVTELHYLDFTYRTTSVAEWDTIYLHQNDFPYEWNEEVCPTPGEYFHWTKYDPEGCNKEMLRVRLVLRDTVEMTGCEGDTILWRCTPAYETKVYSEQVTAIGAVSGEETITELHSLDFTYRTTSVAEWDTIFLHQNDFPYEWNDEVCPTPGEYAHWTKYDPEGCNKEMLRVRLVLRDTIEGYTCNGDTMLWRCTEAYETKVYGEEVKAIGAISGEETVTELHYLDFTFFSAPVDSILNDTITDGALLPYLWRGLSLDRDTTCHDTVYVVPNDPSSCIDSLLTLNLRIETITYDTTYATICQGDTLLWRCKQLPEAGTYDDVLSYASGNDSIRYTLELTVNKDSVAPWDTVYVNEFPYNREGWEEINAPGEYSLQTVYTETGCDSVLYRLRVVLRDTVEGYTCNGDTMLWRCTEAYETKVYGDTVKAVGAISGEETVTELHYLDFTFFSAPVDSILNDTVTNSALLPYEWRGLSLDRDTTCHDTVYVVPNDPSSCIDSLLTLNLRIETITYDTTYATICQGDTLLWRCKQLPEAGTYDDVLSYASGNDSIRYTLELTVNKDSVAPWDTVYVNEFPYNRDGWEEINAPGEYSLQTVYTETGCDSILYRLRVVLRDTVEGYTCNGDTMLWRCTEAYETKVYGDTVKAVGAISGEETVTELHYLDFTFNAAPVDSILNDTVTDSALLPYLWRGLSLDRDTTCHDTVYVVSNDPSSCIDSLFTLNLRIELPIDSVRYDTICNGDTLRWHIFEGTETGIYADTLRYASGNDSIRYLLNLEVHMDSVAPLEQVILCNGDSLLWYDEETGEMTRWLKEPSIEPYKCMTHYPKTKYQEEHGLEGCDSVYHTLILIVKPLIVKELTDTICYDPLDRTYKWLSWDDHYTTSEIPNDKYSQEYTFTDTAHYAFPYQCDSVQSSIKVYVRRVDERDGTGEFLTKDTLCAADGVVPSEYQWTIAADGGRTKQIVLTPEEQTRKGRFVITRGDTLLYSPSDRGLVCDSAYYQLNLYVFRPELDPNDPTKVYVDVKDTTICYSDSYEWMGETYSLADADEVTQMVISERILPYQGTDCDSVTCRLQLHFYQAADTIVEPDTVPICKDGQYIWRGKTIKEAGVYLDSTYYEGTQCIDHYFKVIVKELLPTTIDTTATFCQGGSFAWDRSGEELTEAGTYEYKVSYEELEGCDHFIYRLHLSELVPVEVEPETQYICNGESYTWHGKTFNTTGIYRDTIYYVQSHCDSAYYTLNLEKQLPMDKQKDTLYICGSGQVTWPFNNHVYSHAGMYYDTIPSMHGCDSIAGELTVIEQQAVTAEPEYATIYQTQVYTWRDGKDYDEAGDYEYVEKYMSGCDSVIYTLHLTILDIDHRVVEVTDIVCPGETYEGHLINEHTQWADTVRTTEEGGALVDVVTKYDIDVYEFSLPEGFMGFVGVSCGMPVVVDSALTLLQQHIDSYENFAPEASITWSYREDEGQWKPLSGTADGQVALDGKTENVTVRCELTTQCGVKSQEQTYEVGKRATPETFTEYDLLPVIVKYNGTMLMVDVDAICTKFGWRNGVELRPEDVQWYERVGKIDNLSYPDPNDPKDIPTNKWGYYYIPQDEADYYALIKGKLEVQEDDCGVWARTLVVEGASPIQLNPNVSQGGASITVSGVAQCYVTIRDMYGNIVMARTAVSGSFKAPGAAGTYFVQIEDGSSVAHRTLIVY